MAVSPYEYAVMSSEVYNNGGGTPPPGWTVLDTSGIFSLNQYYGVAYLNSSTNEVVIAHRGTQPTNPLDLASDIQLSLGFVPGQFLEAMSFIDEIKALPQNYSVTFTGHSLGATLADLSNATYLDDTVTFESPGSVSILLAQGFSQAQIDAITNITAYNAAPNGINTVNEHVGQVIRIYPDYSPGIPLVHETSIASYVAYTLPPRQHSMDGVRAQFSPSTGNPYIESTQTDTWPIIPTSLGLPLIFSDVSGGYVWFRSYADNPEYWNQYFLTDPGSFPDVQSKVNYITTYLGGAAVFNTSQQGVTITGDDTGNNIWGTTNHRDTVTAMGGDDTIFGHGGDDSLDGGAGDDVIAGDGGTGSQNDTNVGGGDDIIIGGAGNDTLTGFMGNDSITGDADDDSIVGGQGDDTADGGDGNDTLVSLSGADFLIGGNDQDIFDIRSFNSTTVPGGTGDSITVDDYEFDVDQIEISGEFGNLNAADLKIDINGNDIEIRTGDAQVDDKLLFTGVDTLFEAVIDDDDSKIVINNNPTESRVLDGNQAKATDDHLIGGDNGDHIEDYDGDDRVVAGDGSDAIRIWQGNDSIQTGAGVDTITFNDAFGADTITDFADDIDKIELLVSDVVDFNDLTITQNGLDAIVSTTSSGTIVLQNFDSVNLTGSDFIFLGCEGGSCDAGTEGDDSIVGAPGVAEAFYGFGGNDTIEAGDLSDTVYGGDGNDSIELDDFSAIPEDMAPDTAFGGNGDDYIIGSNDKIYGGEGSDYIQGGYGQNLLDGGEGNDYIYAGVPKFATPGDDADTLLGGPGDDALLFDFSTFYYGVVNYTLDGGDGMDVVSFATNSPLIFSAIDLNLSTGQAISIVDDAPAGIHTLSNIENVVGTSKDDTIIGDAGDNILNGYTGHDIIDGGAGSDGISFSFASNLTVDLAAGTAFLDDFYTMTLTSIENIFGSNGGDTLLGDSGDNIIEGLGFGDTIDGRGGNDTAIYTSSNSWVNVDLLTGVRVGNGHGGDLLTSIENLGGSAFGDTLTGDNTNNSIDGAGGDDSITDNYGSDTITGGIGNDTIAITENAGDNDVITDFVPTAPNEKIDISSFSDVTAFADLTITGAGADAIISFANGQTLTLQNVTPGELSNSNFIFYDGTPQLIIGDDDDNSLEGGDGDDQIFGLGGNDVVLGGNGNDELYGDEIFVDPDAGDDLIFGGNGDDTIFAGSGSQNDTIFGGNDNDSIVAGGGAGSSTDGGSGDDTISASNGIASGGDDDDFVFSSGGGVTNTLNGGGGQDTIRVGFATSSISGDGGDDLFESYNGGDKIIDGGADNDTISYFSLDDPVNISLATGQATANGFFITNDTLLNIENIQDSFYADTITGDGNDNLIELSTGADIIDGDAGNDTIAYNFWVYGAGMTIDLAAGTAVGWFDKNDTISNVENVIGSDRDDSITGDANANLLDGYDGNDTLNGADGNDTLTGGLDDDLFIITKNNGENDTITDLEAANTDEKIDVTAFTNITEFANLTINGSGADAIVDFGGGQTLTLQNVTPGELGEENFIFFDNDGDQTLDGGPGDDSLDGGGGNDSISGNGGNDILIGGFGDDTVDGGDDNDTLTGGAGNDSLLGGAGDDDLNGNANDDIVAGGTGNDLARGGVGNDTVLGEDGDDTVYGDLGNDSVSGGSGNDLLYGDDEKTIQGIDLSRRVFNNDFLQGNSGDDTLFGGVGNDTLEGNDDNDYLDGGEESDRLRGGNGDDTLVTSKADDTLSGGAGADLFLVNDFDLNAIIDKIVITDFTLGEDTIIVDNKGTLNAYNLFAEANGTDVSIGRNIFPGVDEEIQLSGISGLLEVTTANGVGILKINTGVATTFSGTNSRDKLFSGANNDIIFGLGGADSIEGAEGDDTIDGGDGNDIIEGDDFFASGNDSLIGGNGHDSVNGGAGNDTLDGGSGNDTLWGLGDADLIMAGIGQDSLSGGGGNDTLFGGNGADTVNGDSDDDELHGDGGNDTLNGGGGSDVLDGGAGDDSLVGNNQNDTLMGGADNDILDGRSGADSMDGGDGNDTVNYAFSNAAVNIDLDFSTFSGGHAAGDILVNIEGVIGSSFNDTLTGNSADDLLAGNLGDDTILGEAGNDVLVGDDGNDTLEGGLDDDTLDGGLGADLLTGDEGNDLINGGDGNDVVFGFFGADTIFGDDGDDFLGGDEDNDIIDGGAGDDGIEGWFGIDTLTGGAGFDNFIYSDLTHSTDTILDTITDFVQGEDVIDFTALPSIASFSELTISNDGVNTLVEHNTSTFAFQLNGVYTLTAVDFAF